MNQPNNYYNVDLIQLLKGLWRRAWIIALVAVIGGVGMFSFAFFLITPKYESEAMMYVNNSDISVGNTSFSISNAELTAAQSLVDTYIIILKSRATLNEVISEGELDYSYEELKDMLSAEPVNNTEVFSIDVTSENPKEAELIANTIVKILPNKVADVVDGSSVRVVDYAVIPSEKISPNITLFTAIGMLLGAAISCMVIMIYLVNDTIIHDEDYLTETYELPVLAVIPDLFDNHKNYYSSAYETREEVKK
ncbi:MAG: hypothetical protein EOM40_15720 [Clostridia bacterium]|nr:hypothetical protein [Clostridia bacterium]